MQAACSLLPRRFLLSGWKVWLARLGCMVQHTLQVMWDQVRVLLGHSFAVITPKPLVIRGSGSQVLVSILVPKSKSRSWNSLLVLELLLPIWKAESFFHYSFWNFRSQNERRNCWSWTFVLEHEWKSQVDFSLSNLELLLQAEYAYALQLLGGGSITLHPLILTHSSINEFQS